MGCPTGFVFTGLLCKSEWFLLQLSSETTTFSPISPQAKNSPPPSAQWDADPSPREFSSHCRVLDSAAEQMELLSCRRAVGDRNSSIFIWTSRFFRDNFILFFFSSFSVCLGFDGNCYSVGEVFPCWRQGTYHPMCKCRSEIAQEDREVLKGKAHMKLTYINWRPGALHFFDVWVWSTEVYNNHIWECVFKIWNSNFLSQWSDSRSSANRVIFRSNSTTAGITSARLGRRSLGVRCKRSTNRAALITVIARVRAGNFL